MKRSKIHIVVALLFVPIIGVAQNTPPDYFVANCFNCHGTDGRGHSTIPPLAGLTKPYIIEQIAAFKAGTRPATVMHQLSKGYTDDEIARAAAYFAAQKK
ncbi:MAG: c-type cytochrome [Rhodocyclaceae bacterium]|nr:c-type cytochrome [Rhodocyclaceae bacterium]MBL0074603.1 c-type cytochrome [Rhodocyclaceae bacterium]